MSDHSNEPMTFPDYEAHRTAWLNSENPQEWLDAGIGNRDLYVRTRHLNPNCWHKGTYRSHDEGCYPITYKQVWTGQENEQ